MNSERERLYMTFADPNLKLYRVYGLTQDHDGTDMSHIVFFQYGTSPENAMLNRKLLEKVLSGDRYSLIVTSATLAE